MKLIIALGLMLIFNVADAKGGGAHGSAHGSAHSSAHIATHASMSASRIAMMGQGSAVNQNSESTGRKLTTNDQIGITITFFGALIIFILSLIWSGED